MTTDEVWLKTQEIGAKLWGCVGALEAMELGLAGFALVLWLFGRRHKTKHCKVSEQLRKEHDDLVQTVNDLKDTQERLRTAWSQNSDVARDLEFTKGDNAILTSQLNGLMKDNAALEAKYEALKRQAEAKQMAIEEVVRTVATVGTRQTSSGESVLSEQLRTSGSQVTLAIEALRDVAFQSLQGSQRPPVHITAPAAAPVDQTASTKLLEAVLKLVEKQQAPTTVIHQQAPQPGVIPPAMVLGMPKSTVRPESQIISGVDYYGNPRSGYHGTGY